jgi:uncharacterized membrane protein
VSVTTQFQGPLPHPQHLAAYDQVLPGAANRIQRMAESQSKHRQELERHVVTSNTRNEHHAMYMTFFLTLALMLFGAYLIAKGRPVAGYLAVFAPVVFHATNYIYGRYIEKPDEKPPR